MENWIRQLRALTALPGISGHEDAVARYVADAIQPYAAEVHIDPLANMIACFGDDSGQRIAVLAHLDSVGLMVKRQNADGTLGVVPVGGVNLKALPGAAVRVGDLHGVIGVRSQHQAQSGDAVTHADDLYIDIGGRQPVDIGTPVTYAPESVSLANECYSSPYLDNRAGCAVLIELAKTLAGQTPHTVYLIGTAQEETTCAGAFTALQTVQPDTAIFVDGTVSYDTPETIGRGTVSLGAGPVLSAFLYVSGLNGWHAHPLLREYCRKIAIETGIAYQQDAIHGLMSDARAATWLGIPSAILGLPMRGKHAPLEIVNLGDLAQILRLLQAILSRPLPSLARG